MKYLLYKDGVGFAKYNPDNGSITHTLDYLNADECCFELHAELTYLVVKAHVTTVQEC